MKFSKAIKTNGMSPEEVFRYLDRKQAGQVEVGTIAQFVDSTLKTDFKEREKYALVNYLDLDKKGTIDRKSFLKELEKASEINIDPTKSRIVLATKDKKDFGGSKPAVGSTTLDNEPITNSFLFADVGKGDQAAIPSGFNKKPSAITQPLTSKPSQPGLQSQPSKISLTDAEMDSIEGIVKKIERVTPLGKFLVAVLNECDLNEFGELSLDDMNRFLSARYGNVLVPKDRPTLIKAIDVSKNGKVDVYELRNVVSFLQIVLQRLRRAKNLVLGLQHDGLGQAAR